MVRGAKRGEGLGNELLAHMRTTDAVLLVVRCFEDDQVAHPEGRVDPVDDAETVVLALTAGIIGRKKSGTLADAVMRANTTPAAEAGLDTNGPARDDENVACAVDTDCVPKFQRLSPDGV